MKRYLKLGTLLFVMVFLASCSFVKIEDKKTTETEVEDEKNTAVKTENDTEVKTEEDKIVEEDTEVETSTEDDKQTEQESEGDVNTEGTSETDVEEIDVNQYLADIFLNKDKRPFLFLLETEQKQLNVDRHNNFYHKSDISFDGKVFANKTIQDDGGREDFYIDVNDGMEVLYHSIVYPSGQKKVKYPPAKNVNNGLIVDPYDEVWPKKWKLDEKLTTDEQLVYTDEIKDDELDALNPEPSVEMSNTKGNAKVIATFDKKTRDMVKYEYYLEYTSELDVPEGVSSQYTDGKIDVKYSEVFNTIEFKPIDKIVIPEDLLNAKEVEEAE